MSWSSFGGATDLTHIAANIVQVAATALTTTVSLSMGALTINDDDGGDNDCTLSYCGGTCTLTDPGNVIDGSAIPDATNNGTDTVTFPDTGITSITVNANAGDDKLTIDNGNAAQVTANVTFHGGTGDDALEILGGTATDIV